MNALPTILATSTPAVRLRVGGSRVEHRPIQRLAVALRAGDQLWRDRNREPIGVGEPGRIVFEGSALPRTLLVIMQRANQTRLVTDANADRSLYSALGALGVLTRCGIRSASSIKP